MKLPLQIAVRNTSLPKAAKEEIRDKALKLDSHHDQIIRCRVTVERPHRHQKKGQRYDVRIDLTLPGAEWTIKREPNEDLLVAIRDSFDAALRRLDEFSRRRRGEVKTHALAPRDRTPLFPEGEEGFVEIENETAIEAAPRLEGSISSHE